MNGVLLHVDPNPAPGAAAAAAVIPLAILEDVVLTEAATGLHLPPPTAGLHPQAAGPAHIPAATGTLPVAAAATIIGTRGDTFVAHLLGTTGHTLAPTAAHPLWAAAITEDTTGHDQDPPVTGADTVTAELASIDVSFPDHLPDPSEAGQDPDLQNVPLL